MDTRTTILNAAVEVFSQHGFRGSTTRRIADAASVNEVTIFRYFGSKEALLDEAIRGCEVTAFTSPLPSEPVNPEKELSVWCSGVVKHLRSRSPMIRKCMSELEERPELTGHAVEAPTKATNELCGYFRRLKARGFTNEEFDGPAAATMLIGSLFHDAIGRDLMPDIFPKPAGKAPARYAQLILRAIGVQSAPETTSTTPRHS
ncbi:MAG: helix-turn-helix domain-containing protein [Gemmatimonadaceae bacterium]|nr:helix-turn-helix domain-containing protein [Gemmatimonadaceae bacterium]